MRASVKCQKNSPFRGSLLRGGGGSPQIVFDITKKGNKWRDNTPYAKLVLPRKPLEGWQSSSIGFGSVKLEQRQVRPKERRSELGSAGVPTTAQVK